VRTEARYEVGHLVRHSLYGYRGVVVGRDPECRADDEWYWSNATQPARSQPWYHVLVHGAEGAAYVAEENLDSYDGGEQVLHDLVRRFFASFAAGRYHPRKGVRFPSPW